MLVIVLTSTTCNNQSHSHLLERHEVDFHLNPIRLHLFHCLVRPGDIHTEKGKY